MTSGAFPEAELKFGVFDWIEASGRAPHEVFDHKLDLVQAADQEGFDYFQVAEHTGTPLSINGSPSVMLSAAIQRTTRIRLGALCYNLPWRNPYRFYNEICMLDQMSHGRIELGIGRGVSAVESAYYGMSGIENSREVYRESLDIFMDACRSSALNYEGKHFKYKDLDLFTKPYQSPYPPLWFPSSNRGSVEFTASHGYNTVFNFEDPKDIRALCEQYREVWVEHEQDPGRHNEHVAQPILGKRHHIVVAETDAEATQIATPAFAAWRDHITYLNRKNGARGPVGDSAADPNSRDRGLIIGSPSTVAQTLTEYFKESTINYAASVFSFGDMQPELALRSLRLYATKVIPAVRAALAS